MKKELIKLFNEAFAKSGMSQADLAKKVLGTREQSRRIKARLTTGEGLEFDELPAFVEALNIDPDDVLRALLHDLPDARSLIIEKKEAEMKARSLEHQLSTIRRANGVDLGLAEEIMASGQWAVGVLPHCSGPTPESEVLSAVRLAVTPSRPESIPPGSTVRSMLIDEFGLVIRDRATFLSPTVRPLPVPPIDADPKDVVHLSLARFAADRKPSSAAVPLPAIAGNAVAVVASTQNAWCATTAAIVGRAIGWGLENTSSIVRAESPVTENDRDAFVEAMNNLRNDGLRKMLLAPPGNTVFYHVGRDVLDESGQMTERHALVELAGSELRERLPFIVVLSESDRMISRQARKVTRFDNGEPRFAEETWRQWRDNLRGVGDTLERDRRAMIVDVDFPWEEQDDLDRPPADPGLVNQLQWQRSADLARKIIERLLAWGGTGQRQIPANLDPEAKRILNWRHLFADA